VTRTAKTPRQRAEEALAVAERHVDRLTNKVARTRADLEVLEDEWKAAQARRDHLKTHPDLATTTKAGANA
jgi:phage shock protein A